MLKNKPKKYSINPPTKKSTANAHLIRKTQWFSSAIYCPIYGRLNKAEKVTLSYREIEEILCPVMGWKKFDAKQFWKQAKKIKKYPHLANCYRKRLYALRKSRDISQNVPTSS